MLRTQNTLCTDRYELDVMVSQFTSHDSTVGNAIGRSCKEVQWKIMYDLDAPALDINLKVQENKLHRHTASVESKSHPISLSTAARAKARLAEDLRYQWPLRATIRGINEQYYFEVRPSHLNTWFPATITSQGQDGFFAVTAYQLDERGYAREVKYPAVPRSDLREAASQRPLEIPESSLFLHVPKEDPVHAALSMDGNLVTHHFGRPSPPPSLNASKEEAAARQKGGEVIKEKPRIGLKVSMDRSIVKANVGHSTLSHFVSGEARAARDEADRFKHSWTFQLGPLAKHVIKVTKNYTLGKIITLTVDDEVFVEASAADIGCKGGAWQCNFRFVGERLLDFEVSKTNSDGDALDELDHIVERRRYVHECSVVVPNDMDFRSAQLIIDGKAFREMPVMPESHEEPHLSMSPQVMLQTYGISVPYSKVDSSAPSSIAHMANVILQTTEISKFAASGFFASCCQSSAGQLWGSVAEPPEVINSGSSSIML